MDDYRWTYDGHQLLQNSVGIKQNKEIQEMLQGKKCVEPSRREKLRERILKLAVIAVHFIIVKDIRYTCSLPYSSHQMTLRSQATIEALCVIG